MPSEEESPPSRSRRGEAQEGSLAELLCALSFATSVGLGDRMEHGLRSAYIGLRLTEALALPPTDREAVFYGALLKDAGCTSCGTALAAFFPDQTVPNLDMMLTGRSQLQGMLHLLTRHVPVDGALPDRLAKFLSFVVHCQPVMRESVAGHCEVAELFARRLGFGEHVQRTVRFQWERWDGKGLAYALKKQEAPVAARVLHLAQMVEFAHSLGGPAESERLVNERSGTRFDPEISGAFLALSAQREFWGLLDSQDTQEAILALAPPTDADRTTHSRMDAVCEALADLADAKTVDAHGHSRNVASIAADIARQLHLTADDETRVWRAALVHDLGTVALSVGVLEKGSRRSPGEWEQFRLHPYYTHRVLGAAGGLREFAADAAAHHEQLDGNGYHRQLTQQQLTMNARILAVADRYAELLQTGHEPDRALRELRDIVSAQLDVSCYEALARSLGATESIRSPLPAPPVPHGLSERECEVLRLLAHGMSNPEIAELLVISRKTVEHHVEHIFNKLGVTSRTAAVAYALQGGLT